LITLPAVAEQSVAPQSERNVRPGVNRRFVSPQLDVPQFIAVFENERREIAKHRQQIVDALALAAGMDVVDVGAGTGLFLAPFAEKIGPDGKVYALEISPRFVDSMRSRLREEKVQRVEVVLSNERFVELPASSIDLAFVCDTYHHFEYPRSMLASLREALRPGGSLVVIDFERIPGQSRKWVVDHVRAGKEVVIEEIEAAGFAFDREIKVTGLRENYMLRFKRP
jgi:ubiquinone/menaquinone biosynthesis C-methylase UbiE